MFVLRSSFGNPSVILYSSYI